MRVVHILSYGLAKELTNAVSDMDCMLIAC